MQSELFGAFLLFCSLRELVIKSKSLPNINFKVYRIQANKIVLTGLSSFSTLLSNPVLDLCSQADGRKI